MDILIAILLGAVGGVLAGLFGVGVGILFVPTLTLGLGLTQIHAEATSLLAILPTAAVGSWRQYRYGNVRLRAAAMVGIGSVVGVELGVVVAVALPEDVLRRLFAGLLLCAAVQLAWSARRPRAE